MRADLFASVLFRGTRTPSPYSNRLEEYRRLERVGTARSAIVQELESRVLLAASTISSIDPGTSLSSGITIGGVTYFDGNNAGSGDELIRSDGTSNGTYQVVNLLGGAGDADPHDFFNFDGELYFEGSGTTGSVNNLYKSDGTAAGTSVLLMFSNVTNAEPCFTQIGNELYFFGTDSSGNENLYKTDGTSAGTALVQTLAALSPAPLALSTPSMANLNGTLYFTTPDLWKLGADGEPDLVKSFGDQNAAGGELIAVNNTLYFKAQDPTNPYQLDLWESDGTAAGTNVLWTDGISDLPGEQDFLAFNNDLYFITETSTSGDQLYRTDGTVAGTTLLTSPGFTFDAQLGFAVANGKLFLAASSGPSTGATIWTTDGTGAGTAPVIDASIGVTSMLAGNDVLYFISNNGDLYDTDGTNAGLADPTETSNGWIANRLLGQSDGGLVFGATDSTGTETTWVLPAAAALSPTSRPPPVVTPPFTPPDTTITSGLATPVPVSNAGTNNSYGQGVSIGGFLYYSMDDGVHGSQIWKTDGTAAGATMVTDFNASSQDGATPIDLTNFDGALYFIAQSSGGSSGLYETDGTPNGTLLVQENTTFIIGQISNELYFTGIDSSGNIQLYKTDDTPAGTVLVPGVLNYNVSNIRFGGESTELNFEIMGGNLYVELGDELLKVMPDDQYQVLASFSLAAFPYVPDEYDMFATSNTVYFTANNPNNSSQLALYESDGTTAGTSILVSDVGASGLLDPDGITAVSLGDQLIYATSEGLYRTDGTVAGTFELRPYGSNPIAAGNYVYFTQSSDSYNTNDPTVYTQLWVTDGTQAGTRLLTPSALQGLGYTWYAANTVVANNSLYYVGNDGRIYQTDGTVTSWIDGVESPQPTEAEVQSASPQNIYGLMGLSSNGLVFSADYAQYGQQLWVVSLQGALTPGAGWPPSPMSPPVPASPPVVASPPPPSSVPASALIPTLGRVSLAGQVVAGSKLDASVPIIFTNSGSKMTGKMTVELFAETATTLDGTQVLLSTKTRRVSLKSDQRTAFVFDVKSLPASLQGGDYHLIAQVIDPSGDTNTIATSQTVQLESRTVQPSVMVAAATPATIAAGTFGAVVITVTNTGNAAATSGTMTLGLSADGTNPLPGITLDTVHAGLAIPAGKRRRLRLRFKVPSGIATGSYYPYVLVSLDGIQAHAAGSSQFAVN